MSSTWSKRLLELTFIVINHIFLFLSKGVLGKKMKKEEIIESSRKKLIFKIVKDLTNE